MGFCKKVMDYIYECFFWKREKECECKCEKKKWW